jgi:hypothetical protein
MVTLFYISKIVFRILPMKCISVLFLFLILGNRLVKYEKINKWEQGRCRVNFDGEVDRR